MFRRYGQHRTFESITGVPASVDDGCFYITFDPHEVRSKCYHFIPPVAVARDIQRPIVIIFPFRKCHIEPQATADIASAKGMMGSKGVRFLPVVTDESQDRKGGEVVLEEGVSDLSTAEAVPLKEEEHAAENDTTEGPSGAQVVVGVLSRESVRIAGRLTETERAVQDMSKASTVTT